MECGKMSSTLYIQTDQNIKVTKEEVLLGDIAQLSCNQEQILETCKKILVYQMPAKQYGFYTITAVDLIRAIQMMQSDLKIIHLGEPEIILNYMKKEKENVFLSWVRTIAACVLTLFGTMFSIMTFHTDADIVSLFEKIHADFMGSSSVGMETLEISYSIGIGIGVFIFFRHFGKWKKNQDPTPLEVEMKTYEADINRTILDLENRKRV